MAPAESAMPPRVSFKPNGTMSPAEEAYVVRQFERDTLVQLSAGSWVSLLGPRKYGKSSALRRIQSRLNESGYSCAFIDVQAYGEPDQQYAQFLEWFAERLASEIGTEFIRPRKKRRRKQLDYWLQEVATPEFPNLAILIDEAGGVPAPFRRPFFSQLRAIHNSRGRPDSVAERLVFAFAGTFRPNRMIDNLNSPFNVSNEINPEDLTEEEVGELASLGLDHDAARYAQRAFSETGGQPYYVQHLFEAVQKTSAGADARNTAFDSALEELRSGANGHLEDLTRFVDEDDELRAQVPRILDRSLPYDGSDPIHNYAIVTGVARNDEGYLVPRNPIYAGALARFGGEEYP
ncbi:MAG TPA: AAA-like domain-containing protein [Solirubrobacterales bacterium]|nr:AAA-like domain-containing protein [Solirubrobacterales bacterium]